MASAAPVGAALIQLRGGPLSGGSVKGGATVPLERAADGDTPVLSFQTAHGTVRLLIDTGASSSMVTPRLAARLALSTRTMAADAFAMAGGGTGCASLQAATTELPRLTLRSVRQLPGSPQPERRDALRIEGLEALVIAAGALPPGLDGVLGAPTLRQLPFLVDPGRGRVVLGTEAHSQVGPPFPTGRLRLPLRWHLGVPLLSLSTVNGPVAALVDTGAEGLFLTPTLASRLHPLGTAQPLRLVGFCGEQPALRQPLAGVALSREPMPIRSDRQVLAIILDSPIFSQLGVEAIVGQELLRHHVQHWRLDSRPPRLELW